MRLLLQLFISTASVSFVSFNSSFRSFLLRGVPTPITSLFIFLFFYQYGLISSLSQVYQSGRGFQGKQEVVRTNVYRGRSELRRKVNADIVRGNAETYLLP